MHCIVDLWIVKYLSLDGGLLSITIVWFSFEIRDLRTFHFNYCLSLGLLVQCLLKVWTCAVYIGNVGNQVAWSYETLSNA